MNVLIFPGGSEIGLEIHKSLAYVRGVNLFSAGTDIPNHAPYVYKNHFIVPSIHENGWVDALNKIIIDNKIDYVFPAYDDIIIALLNNDIKARVVASPKETCEIARSKKRTYSLLNGIVRTPNVYFNKDVTYPIFAKPDKGQGSENATIINTPEEAATYELQHPNDWLFMENLPGKEYTIDCFTDRERGLLYCAPRLRRRIRNGITVNSVPVSDDIFYVDAKKINSTLKLYGAWFFQMKENKDGVLTLLEIGTRIGGTMATDRANGVNLPLLSIYEQARLPYEVVPRVNYVEIDRSLTNRYKSNLSYKHVYVDYDDTVIVHGKVNDLLIRYLYQCMNRGIDFTLITKHVGDLIPELITNRLEGLFRQIIQIPPKDNKWVYMDRKDSIFIDDSFKERQEVEDNVHIPTFDCSQLELLIDERV